MFPVRFLNLLFLVCARAQPPRYQVPGVGFSLTPDFGTAAIYFADKSSVAVARIEGSPTYKAFMRTEGDDAPKDTSTSSSWLCDAMPSFLQQQEITPNFCPGKPSHSASVTSMLRALESAVDAYLETNICYADIVLPDPKGTQRYQRDVITKAVKAVGLRQSLGVLSAGRLALLANNGTRGQMAGPEQVALSIDFSQYGLNAMLLLDDYGVVDTLRQIYKPDTGGDATAAISALKDFVQPPFGDKLPGHISRLILYGTMSSDTQLLEGLWELLGADLAGFAPAFDPVFVSAIGMARASHERMDDFEFKINAAPGCVWHSKLYVKPEREL